MFKISSIPEQARIVKGLHLKEFFFCIYLMVVEFQYSFYSVIFIFLYPTYIFFYHVIVIVFKTYLIDNFKDFIFVNVVKYSYLYLSIDSIFFLEMCESIKCLDFKTFCFVVIYIIVPKNLFIYIKQYQEQGGAGPHGAPRGGDGARQFSPHPGARQGWGRATTMRGGDEDPILRPCPASLPSLSWTMLLKSIWTSVEMVYL